MLILFFVSWQVFDRFDRRGSGFIDYMNFLELIGFAPTRSFSTPSSSSSSSEEGNLLVEKIRRRLEDYAGSGKHRKPGVCTYIHTYIHVHGLGSQSAGRIKDIFAEIDLDNSGTIDQGEFAKAMKILRVDLTSREIQAVHNLNC